MQKTRALALGGREEQVGVRIQRVVSDAPAAGEEPPRHVLLAKPEPWGPPSCPQTVLHRTPDVERGEAGSQRE